MLDGLLARGVLLTRNDATVVLHQVLLDETSWGVLGSSVKDLGFGSNGRNVGHGSTCRRDYFSFAGTVPRKWETVRDRRYKNYVLERKI